MRERERERERERCKEEYLICSSGMDGNRIVINENNSIYNVRRIDNACCLE
jgi:plastocyanin domain-containing protein